MPTKRKKQARGTKSRSSKRAQGLTTESDVDAKPLRARDLPIELQAAILGCLSKFDLKNARLVCHQWALLAINHLFDKVYISASKKDLDVFRMVSEHETICKAVRTLVYDVNTFSLIPSIEQYYVLFEMEMRKIFFSLMEVRNHFENPTNPWHHIINDLAQPHRMRHGWVIEENHLNYAYIVEGYRAWQAYARYEEYSMKGLLRGSLTSGVSRMHRLHSVALTSNIFRVNLLETESINLDTMHCEYSGSPLSRSWNPLHARPLDTSRYTDDNEILESHLQNIICALARSAQPIEELSLLGDGNSLSQSLSGGLSHATLHGLMLSKGLRSLTINACCWLESFSLRVDRPLDEWYKDPDVLGILPKLLTSMRNLKHLQLDLVWAAVIDTQRYTYKQIFFKSCRWPQLESLNISAVAFENHEFVHLTSNQLPSLRRLELRQIDLLSGTWEAAVEFMRSSLCIKKLSHPLGVFDLTHQDGHLFDGRRDLDDDPDDPW